MVLSGMLWEQSGEFTALPPLLWAKLQELLLGWFSGFHWPPQLTWRLIRHDVGKWEVGCEIWSISDWQLKV